MQRPERALAAVKNSFLEETHYITRSKIKNSSARPSTTLFPTRCSSKVPAACESQSMRFTPTPPPCLPIFSSAAKRRKSWLGRIASRRAKTWNGALPRKLRSASTFYRSTSGRRATMSSSLRSINSSGRSSEFCRYIQYPAAIRGVACAARARQPVSICKGDQ